MTVCSRCSISWAGSWQICAMPTIARRMDARWREWIDFDQKGDLWEQEESQTCLLRQKYYNFRVDLPDRGKLLELSWLESVLFYVHRSMRFTEEIKKKKKKEKEEEEEEGRNLLFTLCDKNVFFLKVWGKK